MLSATLAAAAGEPAPATQPAGASAPIIPPASNTAEGIQRWRDMKFGIFLHWGPGAVGGKELSWSRQTHKRFADYPADVYDNFYKKFKAEKFNAEEWAKIVADSGAKYMVFVTKHHDGFCNWDTAITDYKGTAKDCPFGRDAAKELSQAAAKKGLMLGWYFSQRDWHDRDFMTQNYKVFAAKIRKQIEELCGGKYGPIGVIWFDAAGPYPEGFWDGRNLFKRIYELQPGCLINDRCGLRGDFSSLTRRVGDFERLRPWESAVPMGTGWSWRPDAKHMTYEQCMNMLIRCAGSDGNFLLNIGPHPDGHIIAEEVAILRKMGAWLGQYGKSIYKTRGGPYEPADWGAATCRENTIFLHIQKWPAAGKLTLPALKQKITASAALTGGKAAVEQTDKGLSISLPKENQDAIDTIIELTLDGPAFDAAEPAPAPTAPAKP
ncbi:MAG: alpha-L-fucosidase [Planctomycetaceae bacterium]|nr:alpha-L-fucosidase [Planctomycetaceae bacterium]